MGPEGETRPACPQQSAENTACQRPGGSQRSEDTSSGYTDRSSGSQDTDGRNRNRITAC